MKTGNIALIVGGGLAALFLLNKQAEDNPFIPSINLPSISMTNGGYLTEPNEVNTGIDSVLSAFSNLLSGGGTSGPETPAETDYDALFKAWRDNTTYRSDPRTTVYPISDRADDYIARNNGKAPSFRHTKNPFVGLFGVGTAEYPAEVTARVSQDWTRYFWATGQTDVNTPAGSRAFRMVTEGADPYGGNRIDPAAAFRASRAEIPESVPGNVGLPPYHAPVPTPTPYKGAASRSERAVSDQVTRENWIKDAAAGGFI